jgi:hypothetical protein
MVLANRRLSSERSERVETTPTSNPGAGFDTPPSAATQPTDEDSK